MTTDEKTQATACTAAAEGIPGDLLTISEVAQILKVSKKTLYLWKRKGRIHFVKIAGTIIRIPRGDLMALITRDGNTPRQALTEPSR